MKSIKNNLKNYLEKTYSESNAVNLLTLKNTLKNKKVADTVTSPLFTNIVFTEKSRKE